MRDAQRVEQPGVAVVEVGAEPPALGVVVEEQPDVVGDHVLVTLEERGGGQAVAELVAGAGRAGAVAEDGGWTGWRSGIQG